MQPSEARTNGGWMKSHPAAKRIQLLAGEEHHKISASMFFLSRRMAKGRTIPMQEDTARLRGHRQQRYDQANARRRLAISDSFEVANSASRRGERKSAEVRGGGIRCGEPHIATCAEHQRDCSCIRGRSHSGGAMPAAVAAVHCRGVDRVLRNMSLQRAYLTVKIRYRVTHSKMMLVRNMENI